MGISRKQSTSNFPKNEQFLPLDTYMYLCVSGGKKMFVFRRIRRALFSWNTRSEIGPSALLLTTSAYMRLTLSVNSRYSKKKWNQNGDSRDVDLQYHCVKSVQIRSFFWSVFSRIRTEYGNIRSIPHSDWIRRENTDQKKLGI